MQVIAHRGACQEALENTWEAFHKAVEMGADRIELDVHMTKDKELIIIHDETIKRVSNQRGSIHKMTRRELEKIKLINGEPIPFLDEAIDKLLPAIELNIEIKPAGHEIIDRTMRLVSASKMANRIVLSSFHAKTVLYLAHHYPDQRVAYLWCRSWIWPWQIKEMPIYIVPRLPTLTIHPDVLLVTEEFMAKAKKNQWKVFPYVSVEDERDYKNLWQRLHDLKVDGLCTNYPREMLAWLKEKSSESDVSSYCQS